MDLNQLHFAHPNWFWILLIVPLVWLLYFLVYQKQQPVHELEKFIDKHLIPFLLISKDRKTKRLWIPLLIWSIVWSCFAIALAGPRWNYREMTAFSRDQSLAILLDLSESMNAKDIAPSRLIRAKQKIEDILNLSKGVKIGLIAFAADPHMIAPMTEDKETIRHLLPSLDTDLVYVQGSKLGPALEMTGTMLDNEPGNNKAVIVISDGGFEDSSAIHAVKKLADKGVVVHTMGVGTLEGAPLYDRQGIAVKQNGTPVLSKLEKEKFKELSKTGRGHYFEGDHSEKLSLLFDDLKKGSEIQEETHKTHRFWEEHFYLFLLPVIPFFLWWYRRGALFAILLFTFSPSYSEASLSQYFYNEEQKANQSFENGDYANAVQEFHDPYRRGVAHYRKGDFKAAEEMFRQSSRPEVASSAAYNLANALVQQNKLNEAIAAYEDVLDKWPDHQRAKENLELVKKMLEDQKQQNQDNQKQENSDQQKQQNSDQQDNQQNQQKEEKKESSKKQDKEDTKKEDSQKEQNNSQKESDSEAKEKNNNQKQDGSEPEKSSQANSENKESKADEIDKEQQQQHKPAKPANQDQQKVEARSQADLDADLWLDQIKNDPKTFLKNKFYLESKKNGTKEEVAPW